MINNTAQDSRLQKQPVRYVVVDEFSEGQRLDNFLLRQLKGVPKSRIYKIVRKGEVRVNKKRAKPTQKLCIDDQVRIPPVHLTPVSEPRAPSAQLQQSLKNAILYEDDDLMVVNKPSGLAVHGGSGLSHGLIESMRIMLRETNPHLFLELVHRLDRETSGCLLLAKKRSALVALNQQLANNQTVKIYQTLVIGKWSKEVRHIDAPLLKNTLSSGERIVRVDQAGKQARTHFSVLQSFQNASLLKVRLETGRTHQIRVHTQLAGHSILGDQKYASEEAAQLSKKIGLKRLFLHASNLTFTHPNSQEKLEITAPLPKPLEAILASLNKT